MVQGLGLAEGHRGLSRAQPVTLSAQSSDATASLALASCNGAVSRLNALMDDLLRISKGKAVDSKTQEKLEVTYDGATNVAAEREAFVSASESGSDSESDLFSESDRESDLASSVNSDCDSDSDVDSGSGSQKEPATNSSLLLSIPQNCNSTL